MRRRIVDWLASGRLERDDGWGTVRPLPLCEVEMRFVAPVVVAALVALGLIGVADNQAAGAQALRGDPAHGKYVFQVAGCAGCHGADLGGWREGPAPSDPAQHPGEMFAGPFGRVPARNISQDKETGIGDWTDEQIIDAIRNGKDDEGDQLYPIMPYGHFHFLSDQDTADLVAFLRTVSAVDNDVPERELTGPDPKPLQLPPAPAQAPTSGVERGRYIVTAVAGCGDCHTPMGPNGPDQSRALAGGGVPREGGQIEVAPNITPDRNTGIGSWSEDDIVKLLKTGSGPGGQEVHGLMREVIENPPWGGFNQLTDQDARAVAAYLKSIPPLPSSAPPPTVPGAPTSAQAAPAAQPSPAAKPSAPAPAAQPSPAAKPSAPAQGPRPVASPASAAQIPSSLPRTGMAAASTLPICLAAGLGALMVVGGIWLRRRR